jgi:hypothetical protein
VRLWDDSATQQPCGLLIMALGTRQIQLTKALIKQRFATVSIGHQPWVWVRTDRHTPGLVRHHCFECYQALVLRWQTGRQLMPLAAEVDPLA